MKKKITTLTFVAAISFSLVSLLANAALPPLYSSLNEYKSLLNSQELISKLGSAEGIKDIQRTENSFLVTANKYKLRIDVVYDAQEHPGPARFHFVFHDLEPIQ